MMARRDKVQQVDRTYALARLDDARAYLQQATLTLDLGDEIRGSAAAASAAIQAGIAAADAACGIGLQTVWRGEHSQSPRLLATIPGASSAAAKLRRLVDQKSAVQYLAAPVSEARARDAVSQAAVIIAFAESLL